MHRRRLAFVILVSAAAGCPSSNLPGLEIDMSVPPSRDLTVDPCRNFMQDGEETATDCGGPTCMPCDTGDGCKMGRDCASGFCTNAKCDAPSCIDGAKNGTESDKDCGGSCPGCDLGKKCTTGADCASKTCTNGVCVMGPCMNGKQDGMETDKDCGGPDCMPCDDGLMCNLGTDCKGMTCTNNVCLGAITCVAPMANCDGNDANGCEANTDTDPKNCGKCGTVCPMAMPTCSSGKCTKNQTALVLAATGPIRLGDVQSTLMKTGAFTKVDTFDGSVQTPSLNQLKTYDAVLVFDDYGFKDYKATGDNLADYYDGGGRVVLASPVNQQGRLSEIGRFAADKYVLIYGEGGLDVSADTLGKLDEPMSPLVAGVAQLSVDMSLRLAKTTIVNGGVVVAEWANGAPLIVRGVVKGRKRADLNLFPPSSNADAYDWKGDGAAILRNALLYQ